MSQSRIAIRLKPTDPSPYYVLGLSEVKAGQRKQAIADFTKSVNMTGQLAPFYQDVYTALSDAQLADGNLKGAITSLEHAVSNGADNAPLLVKLGQLYERNNDPYDAAEQYAWGLAYLPGQADATNGLARIKAAHPKEYAKAIADVSAVTSQNAPAGEQHKSLVPTSTKTK